MKYWDNPIVIGDSEMYWKTARAHPFINSRSLSGNGGAHAARRRARAAGVQRVVWWWLVCWFHLEHWRRSLVVRCACTIGSKSVQDEYRGVCHPCQGYMSIHLSVTTVSFPSQYRDRLMALIQKIRANKQSVEMEGKRAARGENEQLCNCPNMNSPSLFLTTYMNVSSYPIVLLVCHTL